MSDFAAMLLNPDPKKRPSACDLLKIRAQAAVPGPGGLAAPDDQGNLAFCSRYALGKAAANGFMKRKFAPHQQLDFDQSHIVTAIVNSDEVNKNVKIACTI